MSVSNMSIVSTALSYRGKLKYDFGSDNIEGGTGDCSSFTEHVFRTHGIEIGPDTAAQYSQGYGVNKSEAQAGDLVFFKNTYPSGHIDGVSHVGIMISPTHFVHLGSSGCQSVSLDNEYYREHFLMVKRLKTVDYGDSVKENTSIEEVEEEVDAAISGGSGSSGSSTDLKWWGDIVRVVAIIGCLVMGVVLLSVSVVGTAGKPDLKKIVGKAVGDNE